MFNIYHTIDIKLATCLDSLGIPYRYSDPVTRVMQEKNGRDFEQCTFWFDISKEEDRDNCKIFIEAYETAKPMFIWMQDIRRGLKKPYPDVNYYKLDPDHFLYWMMDVLYKRESWMDWMRNAERMRQFQEGNKSVVMSIRASQETKDKIKRHL